MTISSINFRGVGAESAGSIARRNNGSSCPTCGAEVNFRSRYDSVSIDEPKKKGAKIALWIAGIAVAAAGTIAALGYGYKPAIAKLKDGKFKDFIKKLEPAAQKCEGWCGTVKNKGVECWEKVKNLFSKK